MSSTTPHQALYRRWRAQTFDQIVGQKAVVETLLNAVRSGRVSHAYLFVGPRGTGKTSMARILAKAINCTNPRDGEPCDACPSCVAIREGRALDVTEMDAASNNTVGDMHELLPRVFTAPSDMKRKVFIIDEVQRITQGWDVLLKTLEEPPEHVVFIFCTTEPKGIRPAVMSRVQHFEFRRLTVPEISGKLRTILEADGRTADPAAVELIARLAAGGMRDAESILDQLLGVDTGTLTADRVREVLGLVDEETVEEFLRAVVDGDALAGIELLDELENHGRDLKAFTDQAIERLRAALVASMGQAPTSGLAAAGPGALADAARGLASIDPQHPGPGGLRLQLELVLLASLSGRGGVASAAPPNSGFLERAAAPSRREAPHPAAPPEPAAAPGPEPGRVVAARTGTPPHAAGPADSGSPPADAPAAAADQRRPAASQAHPVTPVVAPGSAAKPTDDRPATARPAAARPAGQPPSRNAPGVPAAQVRATPVRPVEAREQPTLELVVQRWPEIVALISRSPTAKPLIEVCRPIKVEDSVVTLGFPEAQSFYQEVAERRRPVLEDGFGRVLGMPVTVRCVPANVEGSTLAAEPDGARLLSEFKRIFSDDVVGVEDVD